MPEVETPLVDRLQGLGTTIFAEMSALAIRADHNQYPPGPGIPDLRAAKRQEVLDEAIDRPGQVRNAA